MEMEVDADISLQFGGGQRSWPQRHGFRRGLCIRYRFGDREQPSDEDGDGSDTLETLSS